MRTFDVPGAAHLLLRPGVTLLHPAEQVFDAMISGWEKNQISRNVVESGIYTSTRLIRRLAAFTNEYPWNWVPADIDDFISSLRSRNGSHGAAGATKRGYQNYLRRFMRYLTEPLYGWQEVCMSYFGCVPVQIVLEQNSAKHKSNDPDPSKRPLSYDELQILFDGLDERVDRIRRLGRKGWAAACRDSAFFKTLYAWGMRSDESAHLDLVDHHYNPLVPEWCDYGSLDVRWGKGASGSGTKRRRTVFTLAEFAWAITPLKEYIENVRPIFDKGKTNAIFLTERGTRFSPGEADTRFADIRDELGMDDRLTPHGLRHSYITHGVEFGYPESFMQEQVGHWAASTTAIYTSVSDDYKNYVVFQGVDRHLLRELEASSERA